MQWQKKFTMHFVCTATLYLCVFISFCFQIRLLSVPIEPWPKLRTVTIMCSNYLSSAVSHMCMCGGVCLCVYDEKCIAIECRPLYFSYTWTVATSDCILYSIEISQDGKSTKYETTTKTATVTAEWMCLHVHCMTFVALLSHMEKSYMPVDFRLLTSEPWINGLKLFRSFSHP